MCQIVGLHCRSRVDEQFEALKSYFQKISPTAQRSAAKTVHHKLAAAFLGKDLYAIVLFLKSCAELFTGFKILFQKEEPLLHILHIELMCLVQRILSRFLRPEAYMDKSADELKVLDVQDSALWKMKQDSALWKMKPEVGVNTEQEIRTWNPSEKKRFRLGARAFYFACSKDLLRKLPLDNKVLQHASLLGFKSRRGVRSTFLTTACLSPSASGGQWPSVIIG